MPQAISVVIAIAKTAVGKVLLQFHRGLPP